MEASSCKSGHALAPLPHSTSFALVVSVARQTVCSVSRLYCSRNTCTHTPVSSGLSFRAMAVAIDTSSLALEYIPDAQRLLDRATGGRRRFQVHRISAHATIPSHDSEFWRESRSAFHSPRKFDVLLAKREALDWQADPDDDLSDAEVLHHLHQQAATVPFLSSVISQSGHGNAATSLTGSALSASINASTQGRSLASFNSHSFRRSGLAVRNTVSCTAVIGLSGTTASTIDPNVGTAGFFLRHWPSKSSELVVWAGPQRCDDVVFWQLQVDVVDLFSRRTLPTSRPGKRRRTAFNPFLQVSDLPFVDNPSRGNARPQASRFNGVRHRPDRKTWVAEMKPPKQKNKQEFGNFKSEVEAARAVDAAFYHYGKSHRLNFLDTSTQFLSSRPATPPGLDEKAKVKFVQQEAKLLLAAVAATSPLHSTPTNSLQLPKSPRRFPSGHFRSLSKISSPFSCSGPDDADAAISQHQQLVDLDSICDISTPEVEQTNLETLSSVQISEQGWDRSEDSPTLEAPSNVVNFNACEIRSMWLDSLLRSPPASTFSRSPSPSPFQEEIAYALLEQQSLVG